MNQRVIKSTFVFLFIVLLLPYVLSEEQDFNSIKIRFVNSLTLEPISNSQITSYYDKFDNGEISEEIYYTTDSNGEISIPVKGKVHYVRSDKGNNEEYVKQLNSILIETLDKPEFTVYLNPIFDIEVNLKTDFNFFLSFFRMFKYGSYVQMPASDLNTGGMVEPSCFMETLERGATIKQYRKTFNIRAYFSRDLNSPTKKPNKCSIYAWESIRKDAGLKEINFHELSQNEINKFELPLNKDYDFMIKRLSYDNNCQTDFKMAYVYLYELENHSEENLNKLRKSKSFHEQVFNRAGRGKITLDLSYPIVSVEITDENRERFTYSDIYNPVPEIKISELTKEFYKNHPDDFDFITVFSNFQSFSGTSMALHNSPQNTISGIGKDLIDFSGLYGSDGRLIGWNYLGNVNQIYSDDQLEEFTEQQIAWSTASSLLHETEHQWATYIGDIYGSNGSLILQNSYCCHWHNGLSLGYDPLSWGNWRDNRNGTFTLVEPQDYYLSKDPNVLNRYMVEEFSDLTLYLIGAIEPELVDPILWIDYDGVLEPGITIQAESRYITIQDIIAIEGDRICYGDRNFEEVSSIPKPPALPD
jgi:hypothetical protein